MKKVNRKHYSALSLSEDLSQFIRRRLWVRFLLLLCLIGYTKLSYAQTEFITVWRTDNPTGTGNITTNNSQVKLPLGNRAYNLSWVKVGEPSVNSNGTAQVTGSNTVITFPAPGDYEVKLITVNPTHTFLFTVGGAPDTTDCRKLIEIKQWGTLTKWDNLAHVFRNCMNMDVTATDKPALSRNIQSMFQGCESLVGNPSFNDWDMSTVTSFTNMFNGATVFNQPIGGWNTSAVTAMNNMFSGAMAFNQPLDNWITNKVTNMTSMFNGALAFNQPLVTDGNKWNVSAVTNMSNMFSGARAFNQSLESWILNSTVSNPNNPTVNTTNFLNNSGMDCANYQATLAAWAENLPALDKEQVLSVTGRKYYGVPAAANRDKLIAKNWILTGDAEDGAFCGFPVTFAEVKASVSGNDLLVEWKTAVEKNNDYFTVLISRDGENWTELDNVNSKAEDGNSDVELAYTYTTNISGLQLAEISLIFTLVLAVLLFSRRKRLFISMALLTGVFFTNCSKSKDIEPEALYIKMKQTDKDKTTSESKIILVKRLK